MKFNGSNQGGGIEGALRQRNAREVGFGLPAQQSAELRDKGLQLDAERWNAANPVGSEVTVRFRSGAAFESRVSKPAVVAEGQLECWVVGLRGPVGIGVIRAGWEAWPGDSDSGSLRAGDGAARRPPPESGRRGSNALPSERRGGKENYV